MYEEAKRLTADHAHARAVQIDVGDQSAVERLIEEADLVVR